MARIPGPSDITKVRPRQVKAAQIDEELAAAPGRALKGFGLGLLDMAVALNKSDVPLPDVKPLLATGSIDAEKRITNSPPKKPSSAAARVHHTRGGKRAGKVISDRGRIHDAEVPQAQYDPMQPGTPLPARSAAELAADIQDKMVKRQETNWSVKVGTARSKVRGMASDIYDKALQVPAAESAGLAERGLARFDVEAKAALQDVPESAREQVRESLAAERDGLSINLNLREHNLWVEDTTAKANANVDRYISATAQSPADYERNLQGALEAADALRHVMTPDELEAKKQEIREQATLAAAEGWIKINLPTAIAFVNGNKILSQVQRAALLERAKQSIELERAHVKNSGDVLEAEVIRGKGRTLSDDLVAKTRAAVKGNSEEEKRLQENLKLKQEERAFRRLRLPQMKQAIEDLYAARDDRGLFPYEDKLLQVYLRAWRRAKKEIMAPELVYQYAVESELVPNRPFFLDEPESILYREQASAYVSDYFNVEVLPISPKKAKEIVSDWRNAKIESKLQILDKLNQPALSRDMRRGVLAAIALEDVELEQLADIVRRDPYIVREILEGKELLKNGGEKYLRIPSSIAEIKESHEVADTERFDKTNKKTNLLLGFAKALYASRMRTWYQDGTNYLGAAYDLIAKDFLETSLANPFRFTDYDYGIALQDVWGPMVDRNGQRTRLPYVVDENEFNAVIEDVSDKDLHGNAPYLKTDKGLKRISADEFKRGRLYAVDNQDGLYWLTFATGGPLWPEGKIEFAVAADGERWVFDYFGHMRRQAFR